MNKSSKMGILLFGLVIMALLLGYSSISYAASAGGGGGSSTGG